MCMNILELLKCHFLKEIDCRKREEVARRSRKSTTIRKQRRISNSSSSSRTGRRGQSTGVHQRAQAVAVDRRRRAVNRPVDRLTLPNSRLGTVDRLGRPGAWVGRPTSRPTGESGLIRLNSENFLNWKPAQ